jgi:DNA-binding NtrC family response regulator
MPPLRDRKGDIPLLAQSFVKEFAAENAKKVHVIARESMDALMSYSWPGNVRELRTAVEHAVVLCRGDAIGVRDLPPNVRSGVGERLSEPTFASGDLTVREAEKQLIVRALKETNGNRSAAAKKIGMSRRTLHRKLHTYQLEQL